MLLGLNPSRLQNYKEIKEEKKLMDEDNYANFLNPDVIKQLISHDKEKANLFKRLKKKKLWKPNRLELSKKVKNIIEKST